MVFGSLINITFIIRLVFTVCTFIGVYFPAIANVMSKRLSSEKRSFFYGLIHSGPQFG